MCMNTIWLTTLTSHAQHDNVFNSQFNIDVSGDGTKSAILDVCDIIESVFE